MSLPDDDCLWCYTLGAELCEACATEVLRLEASTHPDRPPRIPDTAPAPRYDVLQRMRAGAFGDV